MTASPVRSAPAAIPTPRSPAGRTLAGPPPAPVTPPAVPAAVAYQRVLHQLVRRELHLLADLAAWAPADDAPRTAQLTGHARLLGRVLLHHHATERDALWPALRRSAPPAVLDPALADWTARCARIDHMLRDVATAGRQWAVAATAPARDAFSAACRAVAAAVDEQVAAEEAALLPLVAAHLRPADWTAIAARSRCDLPARDQLLVLGLALEDACAGDRARVLEGLPRTVRWAWRHGGERRYRAAVVRLRGAPPAA